MSDDAILAIGIPVAILLLVGLFILIFRPKGKQAEVRTAPNQPFELQCAPPDGKKYRLYAQYDLEWAEGGKNGWGLVFDLMVMVDDEVIYDKKLGIGMDTPISNDYVANTEYVSYAGWSDLGYSRKARMKILELGPRSPNSRILVTGKVIPAHDTVAKLTTLYVAR